MSKRLEMGISAVRTKTLIAFLNEQFIGQIKDTCSLEELPLFFKNDNTLIYVAHALASTSCTC